MLLQIIASTNHVVADTKKYFSMLLLRIMSIYNRNNDISCSDDNAPSFFFHFLFIFFYPRQCRNFLVQKLILRIDVGYLFTIMHELPLLQDADDFWANKYYHFDFTIIRNLINSKNENDK